MFLMLLLATALSDAPASGESRGTSSSPGKAVGGPAQQALDDDMPALEEAHRAAARRVKPAA